MDQRNFMTVGVCFRRAISFIWSLISSVYQWLCGVFISQGRRRPPTFLGFFLQPNFNVCTNPQFFGLQTAQFLPTSIAGKNLKTEPGALDASLSFIGGRPVYITGSSGGFLLGCFETTAQQHYYICNPVTREWRALPKPNNFYPSVALAFVCRGNATSLDRVRYIVIRAGVSNCLEKTTKMELETFSSETGEWRESTLTCAKPFRLQVCNLPALELDNVIYWFDTGYCLLAHDLRTEGLELIEPPGGVGNFIDQSCHWGCSEGKIFRARHDSTNLEVWLLNKGKNDYWYDLVARVSLASLFPLTPKLLRRAKAVFDELGIDAIHPRDSRLIMLTWDGTPYWYNHESGKFIKICDRADYGRISWDHFLYEGPSAVVDSCR